MLVLSRRPDSSILVGHDVVVTVEMIAGEDTFTPGATVRVGASPPPA